ncbi:hydroxymethylglutaryl-CoA synthase [Acholeplasma hippikon]|nr:hydroxymethylglutaryl-CoA synthase [Acholeplasma hippikon]
MKIGIDKISFFVPKYYLTLEDLAVARQIDPMKYTRGLMQEKMAITPLNQDTISMAANAALNILTNEDIEKIDLVMFATETSVDHSKAAATNLISILGLKNQTRVIELKQACYAATAALNFAKGHILQNPDSKVLVVASDIARYGLKTDGEATQGAGSVAMIVSKDPKITVINQHAGFYSDDLYDFFRPSHMDYALVEGHYSNEMYKKFFNESYNDFLNKSNQTLDDLKAVTFHIPYVKIGLKTLSFLTNPDERLDLFENFKDATIYNKQIGNIYTGSLYLSLISLLEQGNLKDNEQIGLYSYGSGAIGEFFSMTTVEGYKHHLNKVHHEKMLNDRVNLSIDEYENIFNSIIKNDFIFDDEPHEEIILKQIKNYKRYYEKKNT